MGTSRIITAVDKQLSEHDTPSNNWWKDLPIEVRKSIELGIKQANNNETISHKEARKMYQKWL